MERCGLHELPRRFRSLLVAELLLRPVGRLPHGLRIDLESRTSCPSKRLTRSAFGCDQRAPGRNMSPYRISASFSTGSCARLPAATARATSMIAGSSVARRDGAPCRGSGSRVRGHRISLAAALSNSWSHVPTFGEVDLRSAFEVHQVARPDALAGYFNQGEHLISARLFKTLRSVAM